MPPRDIHGNPCRFQWDMPAGWWRGWVMSCVGVVAAAFTPSSAPGHGAYHDAIQVVNEQIANAPSEGRLRVVRAGLHVGHEDGPAALADIEAARERGVAAAELSLLKARALLLTGKNKEAAEAAGRYVAAHPADPLARWVHGQALAALGRKEDALSEQRQALRLKPQADEEWYLEHAALLVDRSLAAEAIAALDQGLAAHGPTPSLLRRAMDIEISLGRFDGALARIAAMQRQAPRPEPWMAERARLLGTAGRHEASGAAWRDLRRHIESLPNLERGAGELNRLHREALEALGADVPAPVVAPPAG